MSTAVLPAEAAPRGEMRRRRLTLGLASLSLLAAAATALLWLRPQTHLPVLGTLPAFKLIDAQGHPFGSEQLAGKPYVANFVYTQCHDSCPLLTSRMAQLQGLLSGDPDSVHLVTFSVDPANDTPEKLLAYAQGAHADPRLWTFLTGPTAQVATLLHDGFKVAMEADADAAKGSVAVLHDDHFAVVDGRGRLRAYVAVSAEGVSAVRAAVKQLLIEGWTP